MVGTPQKSNISSYSGRDVNRKYGKLEVELAVGGWAFATNTENDAAYIESSLVWARLDRGLETRVGDIAYYDPMAKVLSGCKAIYHRGEDVTPRVPVEVVKEARDYLSKDRGAQLAFLRGFYQQIVFGKGEDTYAKRFNEREGEIAAVSNYFADKIRELGLNNLANKLEAKIKESFPRRGG